MIGVEEKARAALPAAGPISELVGGLLSRPLTKVESSAAEAVASFGDEVEDPLADDDLQLALYCAYELHYRGFAGVDPAWEWRPELLASRAALEAAFERALREAVPSPPVAPEDVEPALREAFKRKNDLIFLDFITDQAENVYPMVPGGKGITEMILSEDL